QATAGSAWVLRAGTLIYLAATFLALRLPEQVDMPPVPAQAAAAPAPPPAAAPTRPDFYPNDARPYAPAHPARGRDEERGWDEEPRRDGSRGWDAEPGR